MQRDRAPISYTRLIEKKDDKNITWVPIITEIGSMSSDHPPRYEGHLQHKILHQTKGKNNKNYK